MEPLDERKEKRERLDRYRSSIWVILDDIHYAVARAEKIMDKFLLGRTLDETETVKGVPLEDHNSHFYVLGGSGTGKSKFLESLIAQDIKNEVGLGVIDPHGDLFRDMKTDVLMGRASISFIKDKVVLIDPTDPEYSVCLNPLEPIEGISSASIAAEVVEAFAKIWGESWGPRLQQIFRNALIALIENNLTLREVPLILNDASVREWLLRNVKDELCIEFFEKYEQRWSQRDRDEYNESTLNKLDDFLANENVRDIFISPKSTFNIRTVMDNGGTILVNLDRGQLKKGASDLLGSLILSKIQLAAFSRSDMDDADRKPFYLYIDEFQDFASDNFVEVLSQSRKYGLFLTLANQNLAQLTTKLRASILSNCKLMACFRVSREDADVMAKNLYGGVYDEPQAWEPRIQRLQRFNDREFIYKGTKGGVAVLKTFDVPKAWEPYCASREDYMENQGGNWEFEMGKDYRRKRSEIRAEYKARRAALGASDEPEDYRRK